MKRACGSLLLLVSGVLVLHGQDDVDLVAAIGCLVASLMLTAFAR